MGEAIPEALLRRDRVVIAGALVALVAAAWLYLLHLASAMSDMAMPGMPTMQGMTMPAMHTWDWVEVTGLFVMWSVMMIAMMIPAATPMILMFSVIYRRRAAEGRPAVPTAIFVIGYLVIWTIYSVVAALAQVGLHAAALLSPAMEATSALLAGGLLVAAGVFQWNRM